MTGILLDINVLLDVFLARNPEAAATAENLDYFMESEAKLQAQLLDPLAEIQATYRTRYLQAYDNVTGQCEAVRSEIDALARSPEMKTLEALATIAALGEIDVSRLKSDVAACKGRLFDTEEDRNVVEAALRDRPDPEGCSLLENYLRRIVVKTIRLQDFRRSKTMLEKADIESVTGEFRRFLEAAVEDDGTGQGTILEIR